MGDRWLVCSYALSGNVRRDCDYENRICASSRPPHLVADLVWASCQQTNLPFGTGITNTVLAVPASTPVCQIARIKLSPCYELITWSVRTSRQNVNC